MIDDRAEDQGRLVDVMYVLDVGRRQLAPAGRTGSGGFAPQGTRRPRRHGGDAGRRPGRWFRSISTRRSLPDARGRWFRGGRRRPPSPGGRGQAGVGGGSPGPVGRSFDRLPSRANLARQPSGANVPEDARLRDARLYHTTTPRPSRSAPRRVRRGRLATFAPTPPDPSVVTRLPVERVRASPPPSFVPPSHHHTTRLVGIGRFAYDTYRSVYTGKGSANTGDGLGVG